MRNWRRLGICSFAALSIATSSLSAYASNRPAQLSASDREHARNAFYFVERKNWTEAILHAASVKNPVLRDYATWRAMLDDRNGYDFAAYNAFLTRNRHWPYENRLVMRAEDLLFSGEASRYGDRQLVQWFQLFPPISGKGKMVYAELLQEQGQGKKATELMREAWINGDFDSTQEKNIMRRHAKALRQQDHLARADRLIWEEKYTSAGRMMFALPKGHQALFEARILLALNKPGVNGAIARIPAELRKDPGLTYERMKWRERKDMADGVEEMLLAAPASVPYGSKWWKTRHIRIRDALENGRPGHAVKLLANHGQTEGVGLADALWLHGWISLVYMEKPAKAYEYFLKLEKAVSFPVSKSRAQYWLGRSAEASGKKEQALQWYRLGAEHNTTFYGQLAAAKLQKKAPLLLPQNVQPTTAQLQQFQNDPRVKVVYMLAEMGMEDEAYTFIRHLIDGSKNHAAAKMTAELALLFKRQDMALQASKEALKNHIVLPQTSYPFYRVTFRPAVEEPLMWAITRQESLFNPTVESSAGAKGMMQVLPSTAREIARKNDIPYHQSKLSDPMYNLRLGSAYLGEMVRHFNGSYILAIAAYNAGPGRSRQWQAKFGHPGRTPEEAVDWIERIPFSETRNYVQRVLENLQVYRALVNPQEGQYILLEKDLVR